MITWHIGLLAKRKAAWKVCKAPEDLDVEGIRIANND
jgi:hypothetical protein